MPLYGDLGTAVSGQTSSFEAMMNTHLAKWTKAIDLVARSIQTKGTSLGPGQKSKNNPETLFLSQALDGTDENARSILEALGGLGQMVQKSLPLDYITGLIEKMTALGAVASDFKNITEGEVGLKGQGLQDQNSSDITQQASGFMSALGFGSQQDVPPPEETPLVTQAKAAKDLLIMEMDDLNANFKSGDQERTKNQKRQWADIISVTEQSFASLRGKHKAFAVGQVVIDTSRGIQKAFAEVPWPLNLVQAAKIGVTGAQQLSRIKGVFHDGIADVPQTGTYLLQSGERVLDQRLNSDLKSFLKGGTLSEKTSLSPTINLTVNGDVSPENAPAWRDELEQAIRDLYRDNLKGAPF